MKKPFVLSVLIFVLSACTGETPSTPVKTWGDMSFHVETRPAYFDRGMVEFLVIADKGEHKRARDLIISIRIGDSGKWTQAIQDGEVGVYRRALLVHDALLDQLQVYVKHNGEENLFNYPLDIFANKNQKN